MSAPLRRTLLCLLVAALAILAHAPLAGSGFVGGDLALLDEAARAAATPGGWPDSDDALRLGRGAVRPIPAFALIAHARACAGTSPLEPDCAAPLRVLALVALMVAAAGAGVTLRRLLVPWLGESSARAAGWACAGLAVAHPASVAAVARPLALGDLLALAAGTWCTAFYLRGRQQRRDVFLVLAALFAIAAGFASRAAWILPPVCALLEFSSAHRPRAAWRRFGAAALVGALALVCVGIEPMISAGRAGAFGSALPGAATPEQRVLTAIESLGVLALPAPSPGEPGVFVLAGALLLLVCEPFLRAVRAAPRLWGWLVLVWIGGLALSLALVSHQRAPSGEVELAAALSPSAFFVCAGLATAATALGGFRRTALPIALAAGLCFIADRTASAWPRATRELFALRSDLERATSLASPSGRVLAVGVPLDPRGFGPGRDLDLLARPWPSAEPEAPRVQRVDAGALAQRLRLPPTTELRRSGLAVLILDPDGRRAIATRVPAPSENQKPITGREWEGGRSDLFEVDPVALDPFELTAVRVVPVVGVSTGEKPLLAWRSTNQHFEKGTIEGAWIEGEDGPRAIFDLARSHEWLLGGAIRRLLFHNQLLKFVTVEVLPGIPLSGAEDPAVSLTIPEAERPRGLQGEETWVLVRVPLDDSPLVEFEGRWTRDDRLVFDVAATGPADGSPPPWWRVECRVGGTAVARTRAADQLAR
jgi:hypothetical protein